MAVLFVASAFPCPACGAAAGEPCIRLDVEDEVSAGWVHMSRSTEYLALGRVGPKAPSQPPLPIIEQQEAAMSVIARFYVSEITRNAYDANAVKVTMNAVSRGPENKEWATATPVGQMSMTIKNSDAARFFEPLLGKDVSIVISAIDDETHSSQYSA